MKKIQLIFSQQYYRFIENMTCLKKWSGDCMNIIYYNNCWFTNVGEAFIDFGGMELTRRIFKGSKIATASCMSAWLARKAPTISDCRIDNDEVFTRVASLKNYITADYLIMPGMFACKEFVNNSQDKIFVDKLVERGCKVIFLGLGGSMYDEEEIEMCSRYFEKIRPTLIVTRDKQTYENYESVAPCVSGIDCAFWIVDNYDPRGFTDKEYDVVTFNRSKEPKGLFPLSSDVIRCEHMQYSYRKEQIRDGLWISDTPYDYLTIYANAKRVYTDLVHATIASLMYETPVKYHYIDKRSYALEAIEALKEQNGWLSVTNEELAYQKSSILRKIKSVLKIIN